jgi:hypothetical protein
VVISGSLLRPARPDLTITITVMHMVSETSQWKTLFIDERFEPKNTAPAE